MLNPLIIQFTLGLISILFAEVVRDFYHIAGHYWQPIKQNHLLHHKAYRPDFSIANMELYKKSQLYNDVPEALCMVGLGAVLTLVTQSPGMWLGCIYSIAFLVPAFLRSQGMLLATDLSHKPGDLVGIPAQWRVNRTYHWRHHFDEKNAYYPALCVSRLVYVDTIQRRQSKVNRLVRKIIISEKR